MKTFGQLVKEKRSKLNLTLRELGARVGVTNNHVADIEKGRRNPSPELRARLVEVLTITEPYAERQIMDPTLPQVIEVDLGIAILKLQLTYTLK